MNTLRRSLLAFLLILSLHQPVFLDVAFCYCSLHWVSELVLLICPFQQPEISQSEMRISLTFLLYCCLSRFWMNVFTLCLIKPAYFPPCRNQQVSFLVMMYYSVVLNISSGTFCYIEEWWSCLSYFASEQFWQSKLSLFKKVVGWSCWLLGLHDALQFC